MAAFAEADWPEARRPDVKIGLHTGEPPANRGRYISLALPRAFRVCGSASAGQVLLSESTLSLLEIHRSSTRSSYETSARMNWTTSTGRFACTSWLSEYCYCAPSSWRGRPSSGSVSHGATERT